VLTVTIFICSIIGASVLPSIIATNNQQNEIKIEIKNGFQIKKITHEPYTGRLRVYIVEPNSQWNNYCGDPYHFAFLGFAINENISIDPQNTLRKSITWYGTVKENNAMAIAVVFNSKQHQGYANPPLRKPFWAYYTDASAAATPGHTGYNTVTPDFTHTVFIEEGTATWCIYCPETGETLYDIYESGDYPCYYVAMVEDKNSQAANRLNNDYNIYGYPSAFFDGGYQVHVGGSTSEDIYRPLIQTCGTRDVSNLNLSISVRYIGNGNLQIGVNITNENLPPATPQTPSGEIDGKVRIKYNYTTTTTDPNDDDVWYWFDWDDGTNSGWIGPYPSSAIASANHTWIKKGTYNVKVKAIDNFNDESNWSDPSPITIPLSYNNPILQSFELLFQRFTSIFPILRRL
jgi:hypothetical protein